MILTPDTIANSASPLSDRELLTVKRILRVNHAGERGAICIYQAQIAVARWRAPSVVAHLQDMLAHEIEHCRRFAEVMHDRRSTPCRMLWFWGLGGSMLGFSTALLGERSIWTCTAAIEAAVHRHLKDQLHFLRPRVPQLYTLIQSIQHEELSHLETAERHLAAPTAGRQVLRPVIALATDVMIWLSTYGASARMARDLKRHLQLTRATA